VQEIWGTGASSHVKHTRAQNVIIAHVAGARAVHSFVVYIIKR